MFDEKLLVPGKKTNLEKIEKKIPIWQLIIFGILVLVGLVAISGGLYFLITTSNTTYISDDVAPVASGSANLSAFCNSSISQAQIYVDLAGAVNKPGLYQLETGSRLATVIKQAGGFADQADQDFVSKELNLAQKLRDGDKIYIIAKEEKEYQQQIEEFCRQNSQNSQNSQSSNSQNSQDSQSSQSSGADSSGENGVNGQISINQASTKDLESLEGIGEKRAADIIKNRPYQQLSDLVEKKVLTETIFNNIQNRLKL